MKKTLQNAIRNGEAIEQCGLTFYPILMSDFDAYMACKDVIELRMTSLPARYMVMDYTSALFAMEVDEQHSGLFAKFITLLLLSLRIDIEEANLDESIFYTVQNDKPSFSHIRITQNGNTVDLTSKDLSFKVRQLLADMNGLKLPDEAENIELVRDREQLAQYNRRNQRKLDVNVTALIASVAYAYKLRIKDIMQWTVYEFEQAQKAITRSRNNLIYTMCELSGEVKFKGGNPYPSWEFDAVADNSLMKVDNIISKLNKGD